jgi:hypothetical protein
MDVARLGPANSRCSTSRVFDDPDEFADEVDGFDSAAVARARTLALLGIETRSFTEALHPRNPKGSPGGGKFRSLAQRVADAIKGSDGKKDPLDGFNRRQLASAAKQNGIAITARMSDADIRKALHEHHRSKSSEPHKAPTKAAPTKKAAPKAAPRVAGLPRSTGTPSVETDALATNPHFGATVEGPVYRAEGKVGGHWTPDLGPLPSGAYEENCTNAVAAFEMRMRGYDVEAAPLDVLDKQGYAGGRTFAEIDQLLTDSWILPNGRPHGRSFSGQSWRGFAEIDREVRNWPEGGRGYLFVGKHIFSVVKMHGKARYIEPQFDANESDSRDVTSLYRKKFGGGKVVRIDDLEPTDAVLQSVQARGR